MKKILMILIIIVLIGGMVYLALPKDENGNIGNSVTDTLPNKGKKTENSSKTEKLTLLTSEDYNYFDKGYYYIGFGKEGYNIKYFDYAAKQEIFLCSKPNCKHNTKECPSFLEFIDESQIFVYNNHLYLISTTAKEEEMSMGGENGFMIGNVNQTSPSIYIMDLDGTNRKKIFECPSEIGMIPCAIEGNTLYAFFTKNKSISIGTNKTTTLETERKLVSIDLESKKYKEIHNSKNQSLLGIYKNNLVIEEIVYKEDPEKFLKNDQAGIQNLINSTRKIKLFNLETMQEIEVYQDVYKNIETMMFYGDTVYFLASKGKKIESINVETKQKENVIELDKTGAYFEGIYDGKLQYVYYDKSSDSDKVDKAYYIDLNTKENKEFMLKDANGYLVKILTANNKYYFVENGYQLSKEYTTWAGNKQRDILRINYALISKEDYWNSKANYIDMKNTENGGE